ncbi:MAG: DivIVA domain-containing protein [Clostridia bacterium]|nr:DivIVA domain-containing protein [Clostridia bacterium]
MLKPSELKKKSFSKTVRGYSIPEVDEYMDFLLEKYTELFRKNFELEQQLRAAVEQKSELEGEKESVRSALINAQKVAAKIVEGANEQADAIVKSSKDACDTILTELNERINIERETIVTLKSQVDSLKNDLFKTYREHIERIDALTSLTDKVTLKSNEEYLKEAAEKAQAALAKLAPEAKVEINVVTDPSDTAETDIVKEDEASVDPDKLFENADTVVFDRVNADQTGTFTDNSATIVIDKVKVDE